MASDVTREADDLLRYYSELSRRLAQSGVRDVGEVVDLYERLRRALGAVSRQEIAWAAEHAERLVAALEDTGATLSALRRLKEAFDRGPGVA